MFGKKILLFVLITNFAFLCNMTIIKKAFAVIKTSDQEYFEERLEEYLEDRLKEYLRKYIEGIPSSRKHVKTSDQKYLKNYSEDILWSLEPSVRRCVMKEKAMGYDYCVFSYYVCVSIYNDIMT